MSDIPDSDADSDADDDPAPSWREVFDASMPGLRAFLRGRLAQDSDVDDCLQVVFVKMVESGGNVAPAARRAWLFRVAANESARMWRSKASTDKMLERHGAEPVADTGIDPTQQIILNETAEKLFQAVAKLPEAWQTVVRLRIHENLTFQQIADQLGIPLGTALTQMRRALDRLRTEIEEETESDSS